MPRWGGSQHCYSRGTPAPTLALGDSSLCRGPRAVCGDRGSVGRGDGAAAAGHAGGSPGTCCRWLSLWLLRELMYAMTWSSEPSGASKHRKVTQPWAGKPPPRCGKAPAPPTPTSLGHGEQDYRATEMRWCPHPHLHAPQCLGTASAGDTHPRCPTSTYQELAGQHGGQGCPDLHGHAAGGSVRVPGEQQHLGDVGLG